MGWILTRAGQQQAEGPYEDAQIVQLIQSGQLREGFICPPGTNQWRPLAEHPPFAQALGGGQQRRASGTMMMTAEPGPPTAQGGEGTPLWNAQTAYVGAVAAPPQGYASAPQGYANAPQQASPPAAAPVAAAQFATPPPSVAGPAPGAPPPGWGGAAGALPPVQGNSPAPAKKKGKGLLIGAVVLVVTLLGGAGLAMVMLGGTSSELSKIVPSNVLVFVELPNTRNALKDALGMDILNPSKVDADQQLQNAVKSVTESFKLDKAKAEDLLLDIGGFAVAFRQEAGREQAAFLVSFRSSDAIEPWLASERVTKEGKFGSNGERFFVARSKTEPAADAPMLVRALSGMALEKESKDEALVWFSDQQILAMGSPDLLDDIDSVITKGDGSLAESDAFKQAEFSSDAELLGFVSADVLDELKGDEERKLVQGYLNDIPPFAVEASFVDAGLLTRVRGQLKGNRLSEDEALPSASELSLQDHLPLGTVAYLALSAERTEDGKTLRTRLLKQLRNTDERAAEQLEQALAQVEQGAGISFDRVFDAIGGQLALGLVVEPSFTLDPKTPPTDQVDKLAVLLLSKVGKEDAANDVVKQLRVKLFEEGPLKPSYDVKQQGTGFQGLPKDPKLPTVQVFFHEGNLLVGVGGKPLLAKALLALGGKDSLASDKAHQAALKALSPNPRALVWVDSGRVGDAALRALPEDGKKQLSEAEKEFGVSRDVIQLTGDSRVTAAVGVFVESKGEVWNYNLEALNAPSLATLGSLAAFATPAVDPIAVPVDTLPPNTIPGVFVPQTGIPQCDGLIIVMFQCGERTQDAALSAEARALETRIKGEFGDPARNGATANQCSQDLLQFMLKNQKCAGN